MNSSTQLSEGIIIILTLILLAALLRKLGILEKTNSTITSNLVLKVTLPAIIFSSLISQKFDSHLITNAFIIAFSEITCLIIAWGISKLIKLNRGETGALMLVSAFGMSTMLGYPIIRQVFPNNPNALEDAVVVSEIGVGLLLFILGPVISMYYGESNVKEKIILQSLKKFILSPIFFAIILGICVSFIPLPNSNPIIITIKRMLTLIGNANLLLVAITIGLVLEAKGNVKIYMIILIAVTIKLILQPIFTYNLSNGFGIDKLANQIVFIESAMPSAILTVIFAKQFNCKPELVSSTILVTLILSMISVTVFFNILYN